MLFNDHFLVKFASYLQHLLPVSEAFVQFLEELLELCDAVLCISQHPLLREAGEGQSVVLGSREQVLALAHLRLGRL
jgi:hypothetical protein